MKIGIVGERGKHLDEAMRKSAYNLYRELIHRHNAVFLDIRSPLMLWTAFRTQPNIIHYIPGPTLVSFFLGKCLKILSPRSKIVLSAVHPIRFTKTDLKLLIRMKPDLMIVHSIRTKKYFDSLGIKTTFLPWGVNLEQYRPLTSADKDRIRSSLALSHNDFVVLAVGHLRKGRNLQIFNELPSTIKKVLVTSSIKVLSVKDLGFPKLQNVTILKQYYPNMHEIYGMADCFLFPTTNPYYACEIPLSVLEAMSCNIPVISTRFRGLPDIIAEGNGFYFFDDVNEVPSIIEKIRQNNKCSNRERVKELSWDRVGEKLLIIYQNLYNQANFTVQNNSQTK